ncbi:MAG: FlgD immunoglobulin-like domain containing protein [Gemmatimonadota bacterium]|nr:FlgD immunoglobulin-like domain containing protein [Gemmatimonadota bacterium]MDP7031210.1 FlgD immunoglobulin-like domain containing protein [Gemmatimonadota bacterium]
MKQLEDEYTRAEFITVDWHNSGAIVHPDAQARGNYYGVGGVPDVYFDGYDNEVGGGTDMYPYYQPTVVSHLASQAKITVSGYVIFDEAARTGTMVIDLEVAPGEVITNPGNCTVGAAIYEDDVFYCCGTNGWNNWHGIGRDLLPDSPLTISNGGETAQIVHNFNLDVVGPDTPWDISKLHGVAYVQRTGNKKMLNSGYMYPAYSAQVAGVDAPVRKTTPGAPVVFTHEVTYTGMLSDDVVVSTANVPPAWSAEVAWGASNGSSVTIPSMVPGQVETVTVTLDPQGNSGLASMLVDATPTLGAGNGGSDEVHTFSGTPAVLLVDDDRNYSYEASYLAAISGSGYSAVHWDNAALLAGPDEIYMGYYDAVIWMTGEFQVKTIGANSQAKIVSYLDAGGNFFLTSHGYLSDKGANTFTTDYLNVASWNDDSGCANASGVAADPIGDGLSFAMSPPYTDYADDMAPGAGGATWLNSSVGPVGIRYDSGTYRTVMLAAAFEGIQDTSSPNTKTDVMGRVLDWMLEGLTTGVETGPMASALTLSQNAPNPFTPAASTTIAFSVPRDGAVDLAVFNIAGRKVVDLADGTFTQGRHTVVWDGRDAKGSPVASGVYLYRLKAAGETLAREMVLTR